MVGNAESPIQVKKLVHAQRNAIVNRIRLYIPTIVIGFTHLLIPVKTIEYNSD